MMRRLSLLAVPVAAALAVSFTAAPARAAGTSYTWIGSSASSGGDNHSWTDAKNWSPAGVPGTDDSVSIDSPDASHCTAHVDNIPTVSLADLAISQNPNRCGVSINGGNLTVTGAFSWNGGVISTPLTLDGTGSVSGANSRLNVLDADMNVTGSLTLSGVTGDGSSNSGALRINDPRELHIASGATLTSSGANHITYLACCVTPAKVVNDGTLVVNGGDLTVSAVEVDQNGTLEAVSGGRLVTEAAPLTAANGASYTGTGGWFVTNGGRAVLSGTQHLGAGFHLELGGLAVNAGAQLGGTASFAGTGTIDWTGGTIEGNFTIGHGVRVQASGAHTDNGRRILSGQDVIGGNVPSTITNHGTMTFGDGATVGTGSRAKLVNASDGTLKLAPGVVFASGACCVSPDQIVNAGTVSVPTGTTSAPAQIQFIAYKSTGTTSVAAGRQLLVTGGAPGRLAGSTLNGSGTLAVASPMTVSGTNSVTADATLALQLHGSLNGTSTIGGAGSLDWTGGAFSGAVTVSIGKGTAVSGADAKAIANINGGSTPSKLTFTTPVSVASGTSVLHDGVDLGSSTLTLGSTTTVGSFVDLYGGKLVNTGTLRIRPGTVERGGSSTTTNQGTLSIAAGGTLHAIGTYTQPSTGTFAVNLASHAHGLLEVQGPVSLKGKLSAHDDGAYNPAPGAKVRVVSASSLTASLSCVITSGAGAASRHWAASTNSTGLVLTRRSGAHRTC